MWFSKVWILKITFVRSSPSPFLPSMHLWFPGHHTRAILRGFVWWPWSLWWEIAFHAVAITGAIGCSCSWSYQHFWPPLSRPDHVTPPLPFKPVFLISSSSTSFRDPHTAPRQPRAPPVSNMLDTTTAYCWEATRMIMMKIRRPSPTKTRHRHHHPHRHQRQQLIVT